MSVLPAVLHEMRHDLQAYTSACSCCAPLSPHVCHLLQEYLMTRSIPFTTIYT